MSDLRDAVLVRGLRRALAVAGGLVLAAGARAQGPAVHGMVKDARTGEAIVAAQVIARAGGGSVAAVATTGEDGRYTIASLPTGRWTLEASRLGYAKLAFTDVEVATGTSLVQDFALSPVAMRTQAIVVTTSRRVERVVDTDAQVALVESRRIVERQEPTVLGALRHVPGVDFFESGLGQQQVHARGFVNPFTSNLLFLIDNRLATLPGLGTMLPGLVSVAQQDVSQLEVVTGPTSALYGPNAGNGVVHIVTRDPRERPGQFFSITGGERNTFRFTALAADAINDHVSYKLALEQYQARDFRRVMSFAGTNGYTINDNPDPNVAHQTVTGALHVTPTARTRLAYSGGFTRSDYVNLSVVARFQVKNWDTWYQQFRANVDRVLGGSLFVQGYVTQNDAGDTYYLDFLARNQIPQANGGRGLSYQAALASAKFVDRSKRYDLEAQHTLNFSTKQFVTTGANWRRTLPVSGGTYLMDGTGDPKIEIDEAGAYLAYDNLMLPRTRLTFVGRVDHHSDIGSRFSPKVALAFTPNAGNTLRLSYNRAYNSPNNFLLYARSLVGRAGTLPVYVRGNRDGWKFVNLLGGAVPAALPAVRPLDVESVELGYRGRLASRFTFDVTGYRTVYNNYISKETPVSRPADSVFAVDPRTNQPLREVTRTYLNYGQLPVLGLDVSTQWLITDRLSLDASRSWADPGTFRKPVPGLEAPTFNAPKHTTRVTLAWREWWKPGTHLSLSDVRVGSYFFQSSLPYLTGNVPRYNVLDVDAGLPLPTRLVPDGRVALAVKNVLDSNHLETPGGAFLGRLATVTFSFDWPHPAPASSRR